MPARTQKPASKPCGACSDEVYSPQVRQPRKKALLNRVRRIEGQVGGIMQMIESDRYCVDILTQISAVKSALDGVAVEILSSHTNGCVREAIEEDGGAEKISELMGIVRKLMR